MIPYSLNVAILIAISAIFYRALLQKETFFKLNRAILLSCLILSFITPLIRVPASFSFRTSAIKVEEPVVNNIPVNKQVVSAISQPVSKAAPAQKDTTATNNDNLLKTAVDFGIKYIPFIYWAGVIIMALNLILQIIVLKYREYKSQKIKDGKFRIIEIADNRAPCSFANSIYINPEKYDWQTYNQILQHEKIHVLQGHSFDLIFTEIILAFQWFNPFAWIYRKHVENNLEYLTDDSLLKQNEFEKHEYQMSLVKVSAPNFSMNITTNYNQSLLKNRIMMMNAKRSNIHRMWKYMTLALLIGILICNFNEPIIAALPNNAQLRNRPIAELDSVTKDADKRIHRTKLNSAKKASKSTTEVKVDSEVSKADYKDFEERQSDTVIKTGITPEYIKGLRNLGFDNLGTDEIILAYQRKITSDFIKDFQDLGYKNVSLNQFIQWKLQGVDASFIYGFIKTGYTVPVSEISLLKLRKITPEYVTDFHNLGYRDISLNQLIMWKLQGITAEYIKGFNKIGYANIPVTDISYLKINEMTPEYVTQMKENGVNFADLKKYVQLNSY